MMMNIVEMSIMTKKGGGLAMITMMILPATL
jgi:hypothetical protein